MFLRVLCGRQKQQQFLFLEVFVLFFEFIFLHSLVQKVRESHHHFLEILTFEIGKIQAFRFFFLVLPLWRNGWWCATACCLLPLCFVMFKLVFCFEMRKFWKFLCCLLSFLFFSNQMNSLNCWLVKFNSILQKKPYLLLQLKNFFTQVLWSCWTRMVLVAGK